MTDQFINYLFMDVGFAALGLYMLTLTACTIYATFFKPSLTETVLAALPDITKSVKVTAEKTDVV